ncbi:rab escort protein [Kwoniella heveanensis CBS 569]|nr:rab escort protein [Kwoniella heveanensis CBS 569]
MSAQELESDHYDVIVIGTGLAESIAAASLAKAGKSILHLDPNEYYGGQQASLTLDELAIWAETQGQGEGAQSASSSSTGAYGITYSHASTSKLGPELERDKRRYALSLFPAVLPSRGKLIETLIASDVSKYVSFRLLDGVSMYETSLNTEIGGEAGGIFRRVPGSKEEVFKDKSVGLLDKRRLMKFLLFAAGDFEQDDLLKGKEARPLLEFLQETFSIPAQLSQSIAYAISHCSGEKDETLAALVRTRRYLRSIGRYGPSAFLVGQYGGAGEVAQGFCRACAVFGGTYVLGPSALPSSIEQTSDGLSLQVPCHPRPVHAAHLISAPNHLPPDFVSLPLAPSSAVPESPSRSVQEESSASTSTAAHCVAITAIVPEALRRAGSQTGSGATAQDETGGESTETTAAKAEGEANDDTSIIVFPPVDGRPLVRCYINGEGSGSCPPGQYIIYLSATITPESNVKDVDPAEILRPYLSKITSRPIYEAYYLSHRPSTPPSASPSAASALPEKVIVLSPYGGDNLLTEGLDYEAEQGERAFHRVVRQMGEEIGGKQFFEKEVSEEEELGLDE